MVRADTKIIIMGLILVIADLINFLDLTSQEIFNLWMLFGLWEVARRVSKGKEDE